jgi:predicted dehydrogenase
MTKKLGLIGVGAIAQAYISALDGSEFARITAVSDTRTDILDAASESIPCEGYSSHEELAEKGGCDAVIVCTPPSSHPEIACYFLERGIPVLCEKPLAVDEAGAKKIISAARKNDVLVSMASKFRYVDDIIRAKSIIASGLLGEVRLVENIFVSPVNMAARWNSNAAISGGGVVIDNGTHSADIVRYLLGPIVSVFLVEGPSAQNLNVEDNALLLFRTASGAMARVDLSWSFDKQLAEYLRIYGTHGTLHIGWKESRYKQTSSSEWIRFGNGYGKIAAFKGQLRDYCEAIAGKQSTLVTAADALASTQVIQAAYQSAKTNTWCDVTQDLRPALASVDKSGLDAA